MVLPYVLVAASMVAQAPAGGLGDVIIGVGGCLAVEENGAREPNMHIVLLAADRRPLELTVGMKSGGADCIRRWQGEPPPGSTLMHVELPAPWNDGVVFALRRRPGVRVLGAPPTRLPARETERVRGVAASVLPAPWGGKDVLVHAYRYGAARREAAIELYVGRPVLNPRGVFPPIRAISVRRVYLVAGRVLATEDYERVSGREERVDTGPPELTFANWSASETERTVAFVSTDDGRSWRRLSVDIGFEGISWVDQRLRDGLPEVRWYLYTPH